MENSGMSDSRENINGCYEENNEGEKIARDENSLVAENKQFKTEAKLVLNQTKNGIVKPREK